jgi:3-hydroxyisobutyrate dehydrogenase
VNKVMPVLQTMGTEIFYCGKLGAGHAVKALNNYLGAAGTLAGFEALLIAQRFGLDPKPMIAAINASTGRNSTTVRKIPQDILTGAYASGFKLSLMAQGRGHRCGAGARAAREHAIPEGNAKALARAQKQLSRNADHTEIYKYQKKLTRR